MTLGAGASPTGGTTHAPKPARERWIDLARGTSVLLVVLFHVGLWHLPHLDSRGLRAGLWQQVSDVAGGVRMPLLLMLSGMLASNRIRRGAPALRGALANYWLYLAWLAVYALVDLAGLLPDEVAPAPWPAQVLLPATVLWYVLALACYLLLMLAVRRVPGIVVVGVLALAVVLVDPALAGQHLYLKIPLLAWYFALGVRAAPLLRRLAAQRPCLLVASGAVLVLSCGALGPLAGPGWRLQQLAFAGGNLGKGLAAMGLAALAARLGLVAAAVAWVGRRTLAIYVLHPLLLGGLLLHGPGRAQAQRLVDALGPAAVAYPLLLVLLLAATAIAVQRVLEAVGAGALFRLPRAVSDRLLASEQRVLGRV